MSVFRIVQMISAKTYLEVLDEDLAEKMGEEQIKIYSYIWTIMIIGCVALDLLCIKWRSIARTFFPIEMIMNCFVNIVQFEETCQTYYF